MKLVYFAWVRERIGKSEEEIAVPAEVVTVSDLLAWLGRQGEGYRYALEHANFIRVAPLAGAREVALFPPMTGG